MKTVSRKKHMEDTLLSMRKLAAETSLALADADTLLSTTSFARAIESKDDSIFSTIFDDDPIIREINKADLSVTTLLTSIKADWHTPAAEQTPIFAAEDISNIHQQYFFGNKKDRSELTRFFIAIENILQDSTTGFSGYIPKASTISKKPPAKIRFNKRRKYEANLRTFSEEVVDYKRMLPKAEIIYDASSIESYLSNANTIYSTLTWHKEIFYSQKSRIKWLKSKIKRGVFKFLYRSSNDHIKRLIVSAKKERLEVMTRYKKYLIQRLAEITKLFSDPDKRPLRNIANEDLLQLKNTLSIEIKAVLLALSKLKNLKPDNDNLDPLPLRNSYRRMKKAFRETKHQQEIIGKGNDVLKLLTSLSLGYPLEKPHIIFIEDYIDRVDDNKKRKLTLYQEDILEQAENKIVEIESSHSDDSNKFTPQLFFIEQTIRFLSSLTEMGASDLFWLHRRLNTAKGILRNPELITKFEYLISRSAGNDTYRAILISERNQAAKLADTAEQEFLEILDEFEMEDDCMKKLVIHDYQFICEDMRTRSSLDFSYYSDIDDRRLASLRLTKTLDVDLHNKLMAKLKKLILLRINIDCHKKSIDAFDYQTTKIETFFTQRRFDRLLIKNVDEAVADVEKSYRAFEF